MPKGLNVREMLTGDFNRMRYTFRYAGSKVNDRENDATHTYFVAMYADIITRWVSIYVGPVSYEKVMRRAIWHDIDEAWSGDMPRTFKRLSQPLADELLTACSVVVSSAAHRVHDGNYSLAGEIWKAWTTQKAADQEGAIVELCDFLAHVSYTWLESDGHYSNRKFLHVDQVWEHFHSFDRPQFVGLRPILDEVALLINEMYGPDTFGSDFPEEAKNGGG